MVGMAVCPFSETNAQLRVLLMGEMEEWGDMLLYKQPKQAILIWQTCLFQSEHQMGYVTRSTRCSIHSNLQIAYCRSLELDEGEVAKKEQP
jgi:hypothetical protein